MLSCLVYGRENISIKNKKIQQIIFSVRNLYLTFNKQYRNFNLFCITEIYKYPLLRMNTITLR